MALKVTLPTSIGESRELYVRVNSVTATNHGAPAVATLRGYISQQAFEEHKAYVYETEVEFEVDVEIPLWTQAYEAAKQLPEFAEAVDC